jgi:enoyl-CoA hydratase/carnithine racemase
MTEFADVEGPVVKTMTEGPLVTIELNRPRVLNSLNLDMIRMIRDSLEDAKSEESCKYVLLCGAGEKAFCAGGDIKMVTRSVTEGDFDVAERFFEEEYALDLLIHQFPKVVVVIADGITMGGGLGLAAGADVVIATEHTRMAMPETGIGFFPDVGATGWLFTKCPKGYPEFLGLTGHELEGAHTVRCGMASHLFKSEAVMALVEALRRLPRSIPSEKKGGLSTIRALVDEACEREIPTEPQMDAWIEKHFSDKSSFPEIIDSLRACRSGNNFCQETLQTVAKRSPTALMLTFLLLRLNQGRPLKEVFQAEQRAASFMIRHPDYLEGVRAQVIEKDRHPNWTPRGIDEVEDLLKIVY